MIPFLKWVGGKRQLLPELQKYVPASFGRYYEPFVGGGALYFDLLPKRAVLSDSNLRLIRTYQAIQKNVEGVIRLLSTYPYESDFYYRLRAVNPSTLSDTKLAAWFIYLNRAGFNGLYRVNRQNQFNVPFGRYTNPTICDATTLRACARALQGASRTWIQCLDFSAAIDLAQRGDFVYFDPPYVPLSATSSFTAYAAGGFGPEEQVRLRDTARTLKDRGVSVLLSNSSAPYVYELYKKGFKIHEVDARRAINSNAKKRGAVKELLIT
jgi:DNA adenine methylase